MLLNNSEKVSAITENGPIGYTWGKLKNEFISKELDKKGIAVKYIYCPRLNKNIEVSYNPTKGFKYKILN